MSIKQIVVRTKVQKIVDDFSKMVFDNHKRVTVQYGVGLPYVPEMYVQDICDGFSIDVDGGSLYIKRNDTLNTSWYYVGYHETETEVGAMLSGFEMYHNPVAAMAALYERFHSNTPGVISNVQDTPPGTLGYMKRIRYVLASLVWNTIR